MNFLIIFADQMHKYALGKINPQVQTPNLDQLAEDGVLFTNGYSNAPICGPYRGSLFTGMYISSNGVLRNNDPLPKDVKTLAEAFNERGYDTGFVGKWHLGATGQGPIPREIRGGFKKFRGYQCYNGFKNDILFFNEQDQCEEYQGHRTDVTTQIALEQLDSFLEKEQPFLQVVAYQAPHYPEQPSERYAALYKKTIFEMEPGYVDIDPYTPTFSPPSPRPYEACPDYKRYGKSMEEYLRLYYGMVTQVDAGIGELIERLKEKGQYENTTIIFTSDHGDMQGSHGFKNKRLPYEKSCGVPFITYVPKGRKNEISKELVSGIDIYPTCLELAGLDSEKHLQGNNFAKYMIGYENELKDPVYAEMVVKDDWRMIRTKQYKLIVTASTDEPTMLFDMINDPYELNNLVQVLEYQNSIEELQGKVVQRFSK
ncbi:sulfatase-like hydrolase/transferase [Vallitalea okinawensis]|uniref:sulfatase-like hydrolase/transferase n=1 Tax=Vallitalea okinawensis TaxID=2078660 RepID=UPI0014791FE5|nr:sulfatase-like hydrolase/transferase [Vallitalea okinawensis]